MAKEEKTEEEKPKLSYDWNILGYAQAAAQYLNQGKKGIPLATKSLELILKDIGRDDPWLKDVLTNPQVIPKTIESQLQTYVQFKKEQTIGDLIEFYNQDISLLSIGDDAESIFSGLNKEQKYSDLEKEYEKAEYIIQGKEEYGLWSDKEVGEAKETIGKYEKVIQSINMLDENRLNKFKRRVEEEVIRENFKKLAKKEEKKEE